MKSMKYVQSLAATICLSLSLSSFTIAAERSGQEIFQAMKCAKCHSTTPKPRGPSLIKIANTYPDTATLLQFFSGKSTAIVEPARAKTMRPRLRKIKKLNETDKNALATYVMEFKEK